MSASATSSVRVGIPSDADLERLVKTIAKRILSTSPVGVDVDDLEQYGRIGLEKARASYDPSRGASFLTWAWKQIRFAILNGLRTERRGIGVGYADHEFEPVENVVDPRDDRVKGELKADLYDALAKLNGRLRSAIRARFGIGGRPPMAQADVCKKHKIKPAKLIAAIKSLAPLLADYGPTLVEEPTVNATLANGRLGGTNPAAPIDPKCTNCPACHLTFKNANLQVCYTRTCSRYKRRVDGSLTTDNDGRNRGGRPGKTGGDPIAATPIEALTRPSPARVEPTKAATESDFLTEYEAVAQITRLFDRVDGAVKTKLRAWIAAQA